MPISSNVALQGICFYLWVNFFKHFQEISSASTFNEIKFRSACEKKEKNAVYKKLKILTDIILN